MRPAVIREPYGKRRGMAESGKILSGVDELPIV